MNSFDWSQYENEEEEQPELARDQPPFALQKNQEKSLTQENNQELQKGLPPYKNTFDWSQYEEEPSKKKVGNSETREEAITRNIARLPVTAATEFVGQGEDFRQFFSDVFSGKNVPKDQHPFGPIGEHIQGKLFSKEQVESQNQARQDVNKASEDFTKNLKENTPNWLKKIYEFPEKLLAKRPPGLLGTFPEKGSAEMRKEIGEATSGYTLPKGEGEEIFDDAVKGFIGLSTATGGRQLLANAGKAVAGEAVKKVAKAAGASQSTQEGLKNGAYFGLGLIRPNLLRNEAQSMHQASRQQIQGIRVPTQRLQNSINRARHEIGYGDPSLTSKTPVLQTLDQLEHAIAGGNYSLDELVQWYHDQNQKLGQRDLFNNLDDNNRRALRNNFETVKNILGEEIEHYGRRVPGFVENWRGSNEIYTALHASNRASDAVRRGVKAIHPIPATSLILSQGGAMAAFPLATIATTGLAGASLATGLGTYTLARRAYESPIVRQLYMRTITEAARGNTVEMIKSMNELNREVEKFQNKK